MQQGSKWVLECQHVINSKMIFSFYYSLEGISLYRIALFANYVIKMIKINIMNILFTFIVHRVCQNLLVLNYHYYYSLHSNKNMMLEDEH